VSASGVRADANRHGQSRAGRGVQLTGVSWLAQDRLVACPNVGGRHDVACFGVFDGTVGDFAAHYCHMHFVDNLLRQDGFNKAISAVDSGETEEAQRFMTDALAKVRQLLEPLVAAPDALPDPQAFAVTDRDLIEACAANKIYDYVSSTGVVAVRIGELLSVAHVGDSRIAMGRLTPAGVHGSCLTVDHKPDQPAELKRIEAVSA
jgi:serine/threonine protein phosphatase PrpC